MNDTIVELDGEVHKVIDTDNRVFVYCRGTDSNLYAFDDEGNEIWKSTDRRGMLYLEGGELYEKVSRGPRHEDWYRLDEETGERLEETDYPL